MGITISFLCAAQLKTGSSKKEENEKCDGPTIRGIKYKKEIIKKGLYVPFQLSVDRSTNMLYFNVTDDKNDLADIIACIDLNTGKYEVIPGPSAGIATAVDNENHIVYLNYADGVYIYNQTTKDLKLVSGTDGIVWKMFNKDGLYYSTYDSNMVYAYKDGISKGVTELKEPEVLRNAIGVDQNDNVWIGRGDGYELFCYVKDEDRIVHAGHYCAEEFCADNDGNLYFTANDGVFAIRDDRTIELLFDERSVYGLAFDADNNMIYTNNREIVRLKRIN